MRALPGRVRRVRGPRPEDGRGQVDRHPCRPDLRFALAAARPRGSLCVRGLEGEVRERLRGSMDQGDEPRSLRPRLISAEKSSRTSGGKWAAFQNGLKRRPDASPSQLYLCPLLPDCFAAPATTLLACHCQAPKAPRQSRRARLAAAVEPVARSATAPLT